VKYNSHILSGRDSGYFSSLHAEWCCVCNRVQRHKHGMENMDALDVITPAGGDIILTLPPYVGGGQCG